MTDNAATPTPIQAQQTHEVVADTLRRWIQLGVYEPAQRLPPERELSDQLGVGRLSLRTAIRQLNEEGLLETTRGRHGGTRVAADAAPLARGRVRQMPPEYIEDVRQNYEFRAQIEPLAARLAAERATSQQRGQLVGEASRRADTVAAFRANDSRFHLLVGEMCANRYAADAIERTRTGLFRWIDRLWDDLTEHARQTEREHLAIAVAIAQKDGAEAERLMAEHLRHGAESFSRALKPTKKGPG